MVMDYATLHVKKRRRGYQYHEDMAIIDYISQNNLYMFVNGIDCWNAMAIKKVTPHSAHSMRTHFLRLMVRKLDTYDVSDDVKAEIRSNTNSSYSIEPALDESDSSGSILLNRSTSSQRYKCPSYGLRNLNTSITSISSIQPNMVNESSILNKTSTYVLPNSSKNTHNQMLKKLKNKPGRHKLIYIDDDSPSPNKSDVMQHNGLSTSHNGDSQSEQTIQNSLCKTLNSKTNQMILNELKNLHRNITKVPLSSTPKRMFSKVSNSQSIGVDYHFVHNLHTLLEPLNEVPSFSMNPQAPIQDLSPTSSTQFYTPPLEFQNGALVDPDLVTNVDTSEVENSSCNTLCGPDIFPALHSPVIMKSSPPTSIANSNCPVIMKSSPPTSIANSNFIGTRLDAGRNYVTYTPTLGNTSLGSGQLGNSKKVNKFLTLQRVCERLNITPNEMIICAQTWMAQRDIEMRPVL